MTKAFNFVLFLLISSFSFYLLLSGQPFSAFFEASSSERAVFRIVFGLLLFIRTYRAREALPLIYGYEKFSSLWLPLFLHYATMLFSALVCVGFFTEISAVALFFLYVVVFSKSKYYSIEDIYIQSTLFHLPFLGTGTAFSADYLWGYQFFTGNDLAFNAFFVINGLIMFSAGYEKLKSKIWLKGYGATAFLTMPHLSKRIFLPLLLKFKPLLTLPGYLVMLAEFLLLVSVVEYHFFLLTILILSCFTLSLFIIVDLSFIGEISLLNLLLFLAISLSNPFHLSFSNLSFEIHLIQLPFILAVLLTVLNIFFPTFCGRHKLNQLQRYFSGINSPIGVFTETHLTGIYVYSLFSKTTGSLLLEAFNRDGLAGKYQFFYPRFYQSAMYPVTDYCIISNTLGLREINNFKFSQLIDLCYAAFLTRKQKDEAVILSVKKFDYEGGWEEYRRQPWTEILEVSFKDNKFADYKLLNPVPLVPKHYRLASYFSSLEMKV